MNNRLCAVCGKPITGLKSKKTCSAACRSTLHRRAHEKPKMTDSDIKLYDALGEHMPEVQRAIARLSLIYGQSAAQEGLGIVRAFQRAIAKR